MKKLIVAAAVAAVSLGAFAGYDDGYDFTATLKTTKGKMGSGKTKLEFGVDATNTKFWYDDDTVKPYINSTKEVVKGTFAPTIDLSKYDDKTTPTYETVITALKDLAATKIYHNKSAGKWCEVYKFTDTDCYRVAGSAKVAVEIYGDCCVLRPAQDGYLLENKVFVPAPTNSVVLTQFGKIASGGTGYTVDDVDVWVPYGIFGKMLGNLFGSVSLDKSTKVEVVANALLPTKADGRWFFGTLAGQGSWSWTDERITSLSGNIVGVMDPPICPNCCIVGLTAIAFDCADYVGDSKLLTAAYGSFRMKYNKKL